MTPTIPLLALLLAAPTKPEKPVDFNKVIRPILAEHCYACHGFDESTRKAELRLDTKDGLFAETENGHAVVPGKPEESDVLQRILTDDSRKKMPPPKSGKKMTAEQAKLIATWIDQGAKWSGHWAFQPVKRVEVPAGVNPIDHFLRQRWTQERLSPAPAADPATLLRRVYLDLIGLPPTPQELAAFLQDPSPKAYEQAVDRLLASPQYGERWGRHWMDVWRYSDWYGRRSVPDVLNSYGMIFRWRDWAVQNVNQDRGYDDMIRMMLAADELAPTDRKEMVATGFVARNFFRWNYNNWMRDNVEHTSKAFLGLTMNCCHCHDHKYDPITQEEYFRFRAIFEPIEIRHDRWPGEADPGPYPKYKYGASYKPITTGMVRVCDENVDAKTFFYTGGDERNIAKDRPPVPPGVPASLGGSYSPKPVTLPDVAWFPGADPSLRDQELQQRRLELQNQTVALLLAQLRQDRFAVPRLQQRWEVAASDWQAIQARIAADDVKVLGKPGDPKAAVATAAKAERAHELAVADAAQLDANVALLFAKRSKDAAKIKAAEKLVNDATAKVAAAKKASTAPADKYTSLSVQYTKTSSGRRSALASWFTRKDNPLTARVAVNHLWGWHFARPLVATTNNFGASGKAPTHPELLDWLASEFMNQGWKQKPLHRIIVTSQAYQMSSRLTDELRSNRTIDPDNVQIWRFPTQRMEAEVVRDSLLKVAEELDLTIGGLEIPQDQGMTSRRRSLYFAHHGESRMSFLDLFDAANPCDAYQRTSSVLPQQALAMTNSDLARKLSRDLATKLDARVKPDEAFVEQAFLQVLSRAPREKEREASLAFLQRQEELLRETLKTVAKLRARENLVLTLFNHSDFVTIR